MTLVHRVLNPRPLVSLDDYVQHLGGGRGLQRARSMPPVQVIDVVDASGLRGRGGAGFPTGRKWRTVHENASSMWPTTVVVNGAEGEPGTFKDRTILRCNPYHVLEGALIAAHVVGATRVVVALKRAFSTEVARVRAAIDELATAGWTAAIEVVVFEGPDAYLYGEETALLETLDGRMPFPRIAPPYRRGLLEVVETAADLGSGSGLSAHVEMAGADVDSQAPPALVDNVETLANIPKIIDRGARWFRTEGTARSPGTIVCTITGQVAHPGVAEILMGTTLREAIEQIGGGPIGGHRITAVVPGVSNAIIPANKLDTELTYEGMAKIGSGLGSAGFWVLDDSIDPVAAVAGVSRFLAVESCGQCTPCKQDGLVLAELLDRLARSVCSPTEMAVIRKRAATVAKGARCSIGIQQQAVVTGLLDFFAPNVDAHLAGTADPEAAAAVAELVELTESSVVIDERHAQKQPDWTYDSEWTGETPVERFIDHRSGNRPTP
jgi:NADH:ubiquinone oxidoreductase subunit F (NADH-binding)